MHKPLLCYCKTEELYLMICEESSTDLPEYQMHILPFKLLLIYSCIFVDECLYFYSGRAVTHVLKREKPSHQQSRMACIINCCHSIMACCWDSQLIQCQFPSYVWIHKNTGGVSLSNCSSIYCDKTVGYM